MFDQKHQKQALLPFLPKLDLLFFASLFFFYTSCGNEKTNPTTDAPPQPEAISVKQSITEPFKEARLGTTEFVIEDHAQANDFTMPSGTVITFPANAFVAADGSPVIEPVTIEYREIHTASDIILSGIPMRVFDEKGQDEWMQTAGMFEVRGKDAHGHEVALAEGKNIEMNFASQVDGDYDFWFFDEEAGSWENRGTSTAAPMTSETETYPQTEAPPAPKKPVAPHEDKANKLTFSDLDYSACPDLRDGPSPVLAYAGTDKSKAPDNNPWIKKPNLWLKKELKPTKAKGIYELTLVGDSLYRIPVRKAIGKEDLAAAQAAYEKEMVAYQEKMRALKNRKQIAAQQAAFFRTMSLNSFGIYNYDLLLKQREAVPILADFNFGDLPPSVKEMVVVYLVTGERRSVVSFPSGDWKRFRFDPDADNLMVAVLPSQEVALFTQKDFREQSEDIKAARGSSFVFDMAVEEGEIHTSEDLQAAIDKCVL